MRDKIVIKWLYKYCKSDGNICILELFSFGSIFEQLV